MNKKEKCKHCWNVRTSCMAKCPGAAGYCTLEKGHAGLHLACFENQHNKKVWRNDDEKTTTTNNTTATTSS